MITSLPPVGTNALLERLSGYVPDDFIAALCPHDFTGGRRHVLSAAQLWRVHLLAGLTTTRSLNLLVAQLPEQSAWRRFARLRRVVPTARMLHEFRGQMGVSGLRQINQHLLGRLLHRQGVQPYAVALMDATDLPASCGGFKKKFPRLHRRARGPGRAHAQDRTKPLVCRLQETHVAAVAAHAACVGDALAAGQLGDAR
ncbi:MAG: transposase [Verrucomicrobiota bacterium]